MVNVYTCCVFFLGVLEMQKFFTVKTLADYIGCSCDTVRRRMKKGELPAPIPDIRAATWTEEALNPYMDGLKTYSASGMAIRKRMGCS